MSKQNSNYVYTNGLINRAATLQAFTAVLDTDIETQTTNKDTIRGLVGEIFSEAGNPEALQKGAIEHKLMQKLGADADTWGSYSKQVAAALPSMLLGGVEGCRFVSEEEALAARQARAEKRAAKKASK